MQVPQGTFRLGRWPAGGDPTLRAWDAADEYALGHLDEVGASGRTLVVNDAFGALAVALGANDVVTWNDSELALEGARRNLDRNGQHGNQLAAVPGDEAPSGMFDVVVVKVPRTLSLLEHQLAAIRTVLAPGAVVVGAGMVKHVHNSTIDLFSTFVGPTVTSLARRKARLLHPTPDSTLAPEAPEAEVVWTHGDVTTVNLPGIFSRDGLDLGARALLDHLPELAPSARVLDLGCGNGILGATVAGRVAEVVFVDDSHLAVASARGTMQRSHPSVPASFHVGDATEGLEDETFDAVLCNPPFHAQGARVQDVAWRMISGAHRVLRPGGTLTLVGNRQLGHHDKARRVFGNGDVVSGDAKFVVVRAER